MIEHTSSAGLLAASEANMVAFWSVYGRATGCTLQATAQVVWFYTGIPMPLFNGVLSARLSPENVKPTCESIQAKIDEQGAPAFWWIGPESKPDNLDALLLQYGLHPAGDTPNMAIDLSLLENTADALANFTIQKVNSPEMQSLWARIAAVGSGLPTQAAESLVELETSLTTPEYKAQQRYIGFLDGNPVAVSAMVPNSGVAGIYAVATLPAARRKGIGKLMTVTPLLEARQAGYRVGILQASPMGYPLYKTIGFHEISKYRLYLQVLRRR